MDRIELDPIEVLDNIKDSLNKFLIIHAGLPERARNKLVALVLMAEVTIEQKRQVSGR